MLWLGICSLFEVVGNLDLFRPLVGIVAGEALQPELAPIHWPVAPLSLPL